jgi:hypothetical protein
MMFDAVYMSVHLQYLSEEQFSRFSLDVNRHKCIFPEPAKNNQKGKQYKYKANQGLSETDTSAEAGHKKQQKQLK